MKVIMKETNSIKELKLSLLNAINHLIIEQNLMQRKIAKILKITQPRVSQIINYELSFSIGALFGFLKLLNQEITITIRDKK